MAMLMNKAQDQKVQVQRRTKTNEALLSFSVLCSFIFLFGERIETTTTVIVTMLPYVPVLDFGR